MIFLAFLSLSRMESKKKCVAQTSPISSGRFPTFGLGERGKQICSPLEFQPGGFLTWEAKCHVRPWRIATWQASTSKLGLAFWLTCGSCPGTPKFGRTFGVPTWGVPNEACGFWGRVSDTSHLTLPKIIFKIIFSFWKIWKKTWGKKKGK